MGSKRKRRQYSMVITFNRRRFIRVIIDPHYEENHRDMTDQIILELVKELDEREYESIAVRDGFEYFKIICRRQQKFYRLVLTYSKSDFLGVINAFRVRRSFYG